MQSEAKFIEYNFPGFGYSSVLNQKVQNKYLLNIAEYSQYNIPPIFGNWKKKQQILFTPFGQFGVILCE